MSILVDPYNSRVKLDSFTGDPGMAAGALLETAQQFKVGKAIAFVRQADVSGFKGSGFAEEGRLPGFFRGGAAYCLTAYTDTSRSCSQNNDEAEDIIRNVKGKTSLRAPLQGALELRRATSADCRGMAWFFRQVFCDSYPSPIFESEYLEKAVSTDTIFWLVLEGVEIVGIASLEVESTWGSAELTDCAVLPSYRGRGIMALLVERLEEKACEINVGCLYSLSRALLPGVNAVLSASGFEYQGRLVNNCVICDAYEDMNIWVKKKI